MACSDEHVDQNTHLPQLYEATVEGEKVYGHILATNSEGKIVLELKGSKTVVAFDKKDIEAVIPYTVNVRFVNYTSRTPRRDYSFRAKKGSVDVGDLVFDDRYDSLMVVMDLNTKDTAATKTLRGHSYSPKSQLG